MLPDRVSNPGPLTYESGALPIALRGPACHFVLYIMQFQKIIVYKTPPGGRVVYSQLKV